jgi:hypothetical protein
MIEWDVPMRLVTDVGTIYFNDSTPGTTQPGFYALVEDGCKAERDLRVVSDKVPQSDGEIFHRRFRDGTEFTLAIQLWEDAEQVACGKVRREMYEELAACLDSLVNIPGRLFWQPTGYGDERMLEACRYLSPIEVTYPSGVPTCTFKIDSPLPYVIDKTPATVGVTPNVVTLPASTVVAVPMPTFSTNYWPVIRVNGAFTGFTIVNQSVQDEYGDDLKIVYSGTRPGAVTVGGGSYAEIVCFNETIYLNGNSSNLKPGIDPTLTDFFYLKPGINNIVISGASATMLVNYAWPVN